MDYVLRQKRVLDAYNLALEIYFFWKGLAYDIMDGLDEGAPGILEMLKRARNAGVECLMSALDGVGDGAKIVLELLQHAAEMCGECADIATEMLSEYWGFRNGGGQQSAWDAQGVELVEMGCQGYPTE